MPERNKNHDILFEPIQIGPVTCKNRFYQVPHCAGMGHLRPQTAAAMRGMKAEGGWGVVCTEYCSAHPTSDDGGYPHARLWDNNDVHVHAQMTDAVHEHDALAGVELWFGGNSVGNLDTRLPTMGLRSAPINNTDTPHPIQCRAINKRDIKNLIQWQADAARRAVAAGFDIVYVYATHGYLLSQFLDANTNQRTDEYGGNLRNRVRIVQELIDVTREAVAGRAAVATRFSVAIQDNETMDAFGLLAEYPDLWDITVPDYDIEMGASRFVQEGALVDHVAKAKSLTTKPVVAVGRFTSPDSMANVIKKGGQDLIGAARPSIADPFLPKKIKDGRSEDIRECIGCNVCYAHDSIGIPIRCTQNPTMGEEWRQGWHPESIPTKTADKRVLVIGAGAAGLECTMQLAKRGYEVFLSEKTDTAGGRCLRESTLKGLSAWKRVVDYRVHQISQQANAQIFWESDLSVDEIIELECDDIVIATGCHWRSDGVGQHQGLGISGLAGLNVYTPDNVMDGIDNLSGHTVIYDQEQGYLGGVIADHLATAGSKLSIVTPGSIVSAWTTYTLEQARVQKSLIEQNVNIVTNKHIVNAGKGNVTLSCVFTDQEDTLPCDNLILLTQRTSNVDLYTQLEAKVAAGDTASMPRVHIIGDAEAPALIADAVYSGHKMARQIDMDTAAIEAILYRREIPSLSS